MTSIIIYTNEKALLHKQDKLSFEEDEDKATHGEYFWRFERKIKRLNIKDRIYFAVNGFIKGSFLVKDIGEDCNSTEIEFLSSSWKDLQKPIPCKPFQGFKYADKVVGLEAEA
jgi:hypothetical protein